MSVLDDAAFDAEPEAELQPCGSTVDPACREACRRNSAERRAANLEKVRAQEAARARRALARRKQAADV